MAYETLIKELLKLLLYSAISAGAIRYGLLDIGAVPGFWFDHERVSPARGHTLQRPKHILELMNQRYPIRATTPYDLISVNGSQ